MTETKLLPLIKIVSKARNKFTVDGVDIFPGGAMYRLDYKKPAVRYQLGVLKDEGVIETNVKINIDTKQLPFDKERDEKEAKGKVEKKEQALKERKALEAKKKKGGSDGKDKSKTSDKKAEKNKG